MKRKCPICAKIIDKTLLKQSRREKSFPFCSKRCKLIDLGKWIDGDYKIVSEAKKEDFKETNENSGQHENKNE